jgi:hypothetical protein
MKYWGGVRSKSRMVDERVGVFIGAKIEERVLVQIEVVVSISTDLVDVYH